MTSSMQHNNMRTEKTNVSCKFICPIHAQRSLLYPDQWLLSSDMFALTPWCPQQFAGHFRPIKCDNFDWCRTWPFGYCMNSTAQFSRESLHKNLLVLTGMGPDRILWSLPITWFAFINRTPTLKLSVSGHKSGP